MIMNYITHFFYENSRSWANSYIKQHRTLQGAKEYMRDTIFTSVAWMDRVDMEVLSSLLEDCQPADSDKKIHLHWFEMIYSELSYELNSEWHEDIYRCKIILHDDYNESQF